MAEILRDPVHTILSEFLWFWYMIKSCRISSINCIFELLGVTGFATHTQKLPWSGGCHELGEAFCLVCSNWRLTQRLKDLNWTGVSGRERQKERERERETYPLIRL